MTTPSLSEIRGHVEALRREAAAAGDREQVTLCDDAAAGYAAALAACWAAICDAVARDDSDVMNLLRRAMWIDATGSPLEITERIAQDGRPAAEQARDMAVLIDGMVEIAALAGDEAAEVRALAAELRAAR